MFEALYFIQYLLAVLLIGAALVLASVLSAFLVKVFSRIFKIPPAVDLEGDAPGTGEPGGENAGTEGDTP